MAAKGSRRPSLVLRLLIALTAVQFGVVVTSMGAWMAFSSDVTYADAAAASARQLIVKSIQIASNRKMSIVPSEALAKYASARPDFAFAAFGPGGHAIEGSDDRLAQVLAALGPFLPTQGQLEIGNWPTGGKILIAQERTDLGDLIFATAGNEFKLEDAPAYVRIYWPILAILFGPAILAAFIVIPTVLWSLLRPLQASLQKIASIDIQSLNQRITDPSIPAELGALADTVNDLLDRLSQGVQRQQLFTANAAHELRTPIAVLQARIDSLADNSDKHALARDVRRLGNLVDQLLSVAKLERPNINADAIINVVDCAKGVVADCAPLAIRQGRTISFESNQGPYLVRGNYRAIAGAVMNLIDNALRAEPVGGNVEVSVHTCRSSSNQVEIKVLDHGAGIAANEVEIIFEPFWRRDETNPGSGLGLAIVREVARVHGGDVFVEPKERSGAVFIIRLPLECEKTGSVKPTRQLAAMVVS